MPLWFSASAILASVQGDISGRTLLLIQEQNQQGLAVGIRRQQGLEVAHIGQAACLPNSCRPAQCWSCRYRHSSSSFRPVRLDTARSSRPAGRPRPGPYPNLEHSSRHWLADLRHPCICVRSGSGHFRLWPSSSAVESLPACSHAGRPRC